jgi:glycyl-tRNA synthetase
MELQFFCKPGEDMEWFRYWREFCRKWLLGLGIAEEHIRMRDHSKEELSHYSTATTDIEYSFPFGWGELWGIANRTDYDLKQHETHSGENLHYVDPVTNERYIPYVIEPSLGADRVLLAFLSEAYHEEELDNGDLRVVLKLHPALAPYQAAVLPLTKKLREPAEELYRKLIGKINADYDETGSIGKRYRRQDEIGTPYCITIDFDTLEDQTVTVRDRDTMEQTRIPIDNLVQYLEEKTNF